MPKILRIINRFNIGGPTYNATFLTRFLSDDYETLLIGGLPEPGESDSLHIPEEYGLKPTLVKELKRNPNFKSDREAYKKIKRIIEEFKPDIVHTHASKAGALGRKAAIKCKVPIIVHTYHGHVFHSYFPKWKTELIKFIERRLAKKTTAIITISETQKKEICQIHKISSNKQTHIIPLGFDLNKFQLNRNENRKQTRSEYNLKDDEVAIAIIGRITKIKNHHFFLDLIHKILNENQSIKIKVFIVGDGDLKEEIEQRVNNINSRFGDKIVMTSWIKDISKFNPGMDIICLTSDNEGTPVSLIEAQASNVAVISTDVGGVKDIINEGQTGFIIPKHDLNQFADKLVYLVKNNELRNEFSSNGWNFVEKKFHYQRLVSDTENLYNKLIKNEI
jgi:glycosyltransferase involved in cell wall biosynthesis